MVKAADERNRGDWPKCRWLHRARFRRVASQALVAALGMVIGIGEVAKEAPEVALAKDDDVIEQLSTNGADDALDVGILPGRPRSDDEFFDAETLEAVADLAAIDAVAITDEVSGSEIEREGFAKLPGDPLLVWMRRDVAMDDPTSIMP